MEKWFDRKFDFEHNVNSISSLKERLHNFTSNLQNQVQNLPEPILIFSEPGKWSIKEHIGHLADLEPLWQGRLDDILNGEKELRPTDLQNTQTHLANHNAKDLKELLELFYQLRQQTLKKIDGVLPADITKSALHPRLKTPMRITDHLLFVAEHDEHHLASIVELKNSY